MSRDDGQRLGQQVTATGVPRRSGAQDDMERVHREFDQRNLRHAIELILASPDAEEVVRELQWRLTRRSRTSA